MYFARFWLKSRGPLMAPTSPSFLASSRKLVLKGAFSGFRFLITELNQAFYRAGKNRDCPYFSSSAAKASSVSRIRLVDEKNGVRPHLSGFTYFSALRSSRSFAYFM